jgi:DNA-directed RNA polymerase omega subunit
MIHPSYVDLMKVVNKDVEEGETPVINSRYSIVMATARRARQIVDGSEPMIDYAEGDKPLSIAVEELNQAKIRILAADEIPEETEEILELEEEEVSEETAEELTDEAEEAEEFEESEEAEEFEESEEDDGPSEETEE